MMFGLLIRVWCNFTARSCGYDTHEREKNHQWRQKMHGKNKVWRAVIMKEFHLKIVEGESALGGPKCWDFPSELPPYACTLFFKSLYLQQDDSPPQTSTSIKNWISENSMHVLSVASGICFSRRFSNR